MNDRIRAMRDHVRALNDAGVRRNNFYALAAASLRETVGESIPMRRAKGIVHLLENTPLEIHPHELIVGSITGLCPLEPNLPSYGEQKLQAIGIIENFLRNKGRPKANDRDEVKTFEAVFATLESRWALMSRVHHDASLAYDQFQKLLGEMRAHFAGRAGLRDYEIGRELERALKIHYAKSDKMLIDELPWFAANHLSYQYDLAFSLGLDGLRARIAEKLEPARDSAAREFYETSLLVLEACSRFIERYADKAAEVAGKSDPGRAAELNAVAAVLRKIAHAPSDTFAEALQTVWMLHLIASVTGGSALSFARFDQYMFPLYQSGIERGSISREQAGELLCCLWLKINEPKMRTVQSLTLGGITPEGKDAANDLTRLCLEVTREMKLPYPNIGLRVNGNNPDWLQVEAAATIMAGIGHPMILNDKVWIANLERLGYPAEAANDYYNMGCVEIMIPGTQPNWAPTDPIAFPMLIEDVFRKFKEGSLAADDFEGFLGGYLDELRGAVRRDYEQAMAKKRGMRGKCFDPFASLLVGDCLDRGKDLFQGGSRHPTHWSFYGYGLGTITDSLSAVKKFVYDDQAVTLDELSLALDDDFIGHERLKAMLDRHTPAFGNDLDDVDGIADRIYRCFNDAVFELNDPNDPDDRFVSTLFSYFFHVYHGEITGATPNGRGRGAPFSDGVGPSQGKDAEGPTCTLNSVLKLDHSKATGGFALNVKTSPTLLRGEKGAAALRTLIGAYVDGGGPHIQFNFVDHEAMKDAQIHPERHRDLIVRVGGYCEFFVNLDRGLQSEIIQRTCHGAN
jgi:formate C-acetyltransferase